MVPRVGRCALALCALAFLRPAHYLHAQAEEQAPAEGEEKAEVSVGEETPEAGDGEAGSAANFAESAKELQEKLGQLQALLDARSENAASSQASHRNRSRSDMAGQGLSRSVSGSVSNRLERRRSISEDVVENFRNAQPRPQRTLSSNLHRTTSGSLRPQGSRRRTISDDMREGWPHQRLRKGSGFAGVAMFEARPVPEEPVYLSSDSSGDDIGDRPGFGSPPTIHVLNMDNQVVEEGDESHHELDDRPDAGV